MPEILTLALLGVVAASFILAPRVRTADGFFRGLSDTGAAPGLLTLVLSQVTTWIFARSLLNAAILGYHFGIAGTLAYAAYYLSFLTGGRIVDALRFRHGHVNVQRFLAERFGRIGTVSYNVVVGLRLVSEVFANLLVVGIVFGAEGSALYTLAIVATAVLTLGYSALGGLRAALRTDILQMSVLLVVLAGLALHLFTGPAFDLPAIVVSSPDLSGPGWTLLVVALLQVWSYPLHDPVMMDRGFLADRETTRRSFIHACWLSLACIMAFGLIGVHAGLVRLDGEDMMATLVRILGEPAMLALQFALVLSAVSTLDSTFASAAKLAVVDMGLARPTAANGRIAMAFFLAGGLVLLLLGSEDLFAAVAVSGTASMFLAPVVFFCIWGRRHVATWAYAVAFLAALAAAVVYFAESAGHIGLVAAVTGLEHRYSQLLALSAATLAAGCCAFAVGLRPRGTGSGAGLRRS